MRAAIFLVFVTFACFCSPQIIDRFVIDDFSVNVLQSIQFRTTTEISPATGAKELDSSFSGNPSEIANCNARLVGCARDLIIQITSSGIGRSFEVSVVPSDADTRAIGFANELQIASPKGSRSLYFIQYDGNDNAATLNTRGLGGVDFTDGGLADGFRFYLITDLPTDLEIQVYDLQGRVSRASSDFVVSVNDSPSRAELRRDILFTSFTGTADFRQVGAVVLDVPSPDGRDAYIRLLGLRGVSASPSPSATGTGSSTPSQAPSASNTPSNTPTGTGTSTGTGTPTPSPTRPASASNTPSNTPTGTGTSTGTGTPTPSGTRPPTSSNTPTSSPTGTGTGTATSTPSQSGTGTPSNTGTPTTTPSASRTPTPTPSPSGPCITYCTCPSFTCQIAFDIYDDVNDVVRNPRVSQFFFDDSDDVRQVIYVDDDANPDDDRIIYVEVDDDDDAIRVPTFSIPTFTVPTFTIPTFTVPTFTAPTFTVPTFTAPTFTAPTFTVPTFTVPTFTVPTVSVPTFTVGTFTGTGSGSSDASVIGISLAAIVVALI